MKLSDRCVETTLRIPGAWSDPGELVERLPHGYILNPQSLVLPDGTEVDFVPMPPDEQFANIFRMSCRQPAAADEFGIVENYTVNIGLAGPGGSLAAARKMAQAGAAIVAAGGGGVFIDNAALSHGGRHWTEIAEDGGLDALSFAFVGIARGREEFWTTGMHVLGLQDVILPRANSDLTDEIVVDVIHYLCNSGVPVADGHILAVQDGPTFRAVATPSNRFHSGSPMHNPYGCLKLLNKDDSSEYN